MCRLGAAVSLLIFTFTTTAYAADMSSKYKVQPKIAVKAKPFALSDVRLLDGPETRRQRIESSKSRRHTPTATMSRSPGRKL